MTGSDGVLGKDMLPSAGAWVPPWLETRHYDDGDYLLWASRNPESPDARFRVAESKGALGRFRNIRTTRQVGNFARRYGPLGLCEHGLPYAHHKGKIRTYGLPGGRGRETGAECPLACRLRQCPEGQCLAETSGARCTEEDRTRWPALRELLGDDSLFFRNCWAAGVAFERVDAWIALARYADAIVSTAGSLHQGKRQDALAWHILTHCNVDLNAGGRIDNRDESFWENAPTGAPANYQKWEGRFNLTLAVNIWLSLADVRPVYDWWPDDNPGLKFRGGTFGVLALQLATAVAGAVDWLQCDGCGRWYDRTGRRPKRGQLNFHSDQCRWRYHQRKGRPPNGGAREEADDESQG